MKGLINTISFLIFFTAISCKNRPQETDVADKDAGIKVSVLAQGLKLPWELLWGPDNMLWMTEKRGLVSRADPATGKISPVMTISDVLETGEGGLLGMALHPDFAKTPQVFVKYDYNKGGSIAGKVVRYDYNGTTLLNPLVLLDNIAASSIHNGSRLLIVDHKLFITTGDAADQSNPQKLSSLNGKILRINLDGSIPADNPMPGSPVWSFGHRNPQGLVFAKGMLYSSEHGPDSDDEVNIIQKGRNFGWPNVKGLCDGADEKDFCSVNNVAEPIYKWTPTIATSGLDFYDKDLVPQWKNSLLMASLKDNTLYQLKLNGSGDKIGSVSTYLRGAYGRLRDVCVAPDGKVYIITSNGSDDKILMINASEQ